MPQHLRVCCCVTGKSEGGQKKCILNGQRRRQSMRNRRRAVSSGFLVTQVNHFLHFKGKGVGWKKPRQVCPPVGLILLSLMPLYECFTDAQRSRWSEQNGGRGARLKSVGVLWKKARAPSWWPYLKATWSYFASSASQRFFFFFFSFLFFSPPPPSLVAQIFVKAIAARFRRQPRQLRCRK